ncbi:hypothetical protein THIAE_07690 [Thiomicrospira aerophila AL3]|uniref:Chemotaxis protein n=1 Tax=Thiomicrospira aerophila AL3 TaxID=717772 RepID=W0DT94_9GAMM|nr:hypothetical protein [Thiomicrospira aerophila]AHF01652.1 hypothetical protein THIAE_07690 [Thiomicrospira aerophila AL3]
MNNAATYPYALGAKEVQETILVLNLSIAQIELSITEGDHSVNALIDTFRFMTQHIEEIQSVSNMLKPVLEEHDEFASHYSLLKAQAVELADKMQQAIIAFQFYDKLSQRLQHVSGGLSGLAEIVSHEMRVKDEAEWHAFKQAVRKGTSMREEEELFELIFDQQKSTHDAIAIMRQRMAQRLATKQEQTPEDDIELF